MFIVCDDPLSPAEVERISNEYPSAVMIEIVDGGFHVFFTWEEAKLWHAQV